jgi:hypothetical protein
MSKPNTEESLKVMASMICQLMRDPKWKFFMDYIDMRVESCLGRIESEVDPKMVYIAMGRLKALRDILHMDENSVNIMLTVPQ